MGYWMLETLGLSLVLTIAIEVIVAYVFGIRTKKDLTLLMFVNILTNPVVVIFYYISLCYTDWNLTLVTILLELMAIGIEGHYFKVYGKCFRRPFLFAVVINAISFGTGKIITIF